MNKATITEDPPAGVGSLDCSAPRGKINPDSGWWEDPVTDCCGESMVRVRDRITGQYSIWHGYHGDDDPRELRCYACDKVVWPNASRQESPLGSGAANQNDMKNNLINCAALVAICWTSLFGFSGCASNPWFHREPYYCVEWCWDESGNHLAYALKIKPEEVDNWEKGAAKGLNGKVTGPYPQLNDNE